MTEMLTVKLVQCKVDFMGYMGIAARYAGHPCLQHFLADDSISNWRRNQTGADNSWGN